MGFTTPTSSIRLTSTNANILTDMYLFRRFVSALRKDFTILPLARQDTLPGGSGTHARWQFWQNPSAATTPLTEGTDPTDSTALDTTKVEAAIAQYGAVFEIADLLEKVAIDGSLTGFADAASYQAGLTIESLLLTELATTSSAASSVTALTVEDLRSNAQVVKAADAQPHRATPGYYCFVGSVEATHDMMGEGAPTWFQVKSELYQSSLQQPFKGTPASAAVYDVMVKESNNLKRNTTPSPDTDLNYLIADDSFGTLALESNLANPRVIVKPASDGGIASPLNMRGTLGWKINFATKLFDSNRVRKVPTDATGVG
jgi:N4-gp56 family major capsid protein